MPSAPRIQIVVVEGDHDLRTELCRRLAAHPFLEVVGSARDVHSALPKVAAFRPEWVVVDLAVDPVGGLSLLDAMREARLPTRRAVLADPDDVNSAGIVAEARRQGVACVVRRPADIGAAACDAIVRELLGPILRAPIALSARAAQPRATGDPNGAAGVGDEVRRLAPRVVGIGVSTGGPAALNELLPKLPPDFPLPILIVQHMPAKLTAGLASSLDRVCPLRVREASSGDPLRPGEVLLAPGGAHLRVAGRSIHARAEVTDDPPVRSCRPSVDYLFESLAKNFGRRVLGVVLTGMGEDGWFGSRVIHEAGGQVLAQDQASSVVYGMPRGPIEAGIARGVPLADMAATILERVRGGVR